MIGSFAAAQFSREVTGNSFAIRTAEPNVKVSWTGTRGTNANLVHGEHQVFGFLTTAANAIVEPVHAKAMPVLLAGEYEWTTWLTAPIEEAIRLQRPLPADLLRIVDAPDAGRLAPAMF